MPKEVQRIVRLLWQKDCQSTAEVNDAYKVLPWQLNYRQLEIQMVLVSRDRGGWVNPLRKENLWWKSFFQIILNEVL